MFLVLWWMAFGPALIGIARNDSTWNFSYNSHPKGMCLNPDIGTFLTTLSIQELVVLNNFVPRPKFVILKFLSIIKISAEDLPEFFCKTSFFFEYVSLFECWHCYLRSCSLECLRPWLVPSLMNFRIYWKTGRFCSQHFSASSNFCWEFHASRR